MRSVRAVTSDLNARLERLDYIMLSIACIDFSGRDETDEGLDRKTAISYYARWKFVYEVSPFEISNVSAFAELLPSS